jgi:hypothetical protein
MSAMVKTREDVGRKVFTGTPKIYRVKCDLEFVDPQVALALKRIITSFEVSAQKVVKDVKKLGGPL